MKLLFVDEIECNDFSPNFFGVGVSQINSFNYSSIKDKFFKNFKKMGWDKNIEFKAKYLFSSKGGDQKVDIDKRIDFVKSIASSSTAKSNAKINFYFSSNNKGKTEENYLDLLRKIIIKIPKEKNNSQGKNLILAEIDYCSNFNDKKIYHLFHNNLKKELILVENPFIIKSENDRCGIIINDILTYLKSWVKIHPDEKNQLNLFSDTKTKKIAIIRDIISSIKIIKDV
jgi:hypothetical protein